MGTKQVQGKLWSVAPRDWATQFEPSFLPMYKKALDELSLSSDSLLLDAGSGSGFFSNMAARTGAQVMGIDAAPGLLEIARKRNPGINFLEEDLEAMPFAENSFDVVAGFNSFQYAGSFEKALQEAKRVLKKGGRLVLGIWDKPEMSEATHILKAIGSLLPPPPPGTPGPFALSEDGKIEDICKQNGLKVVKKLNVACPALYRNLTEAVDCFMSTGPAAAATEYTNAGKVEVKIAEAFQPFKLADEFYHLQNNFLLFVIEK